MKFCFLKPLDHCAIHCADGSNKLTIIHTTTPYDSPNAISLHEAILKSCNFHFFRFLYYLGNTFLLSLEENLKFHLNNNFFFILLLAYSSKANLLLSPSICLILAMYERKIYGPPSHSQSHYNLGLSRRNKKWTKKDFKKCNIFYNLFMIYEF